MAEGRNLLAEEPSVGRNLLAEEPDLSVPTPANIEREKERAKEAVKADIQDRQSRGFVEKYVRPIGEVPMAVVTAIPGVISQQVTGRYGGYVPQSRTSREILGGLGEAFEASKLEGLLGVEMPGLAKGIKYAAQAPQLGKAVQTTEQLAKALKTKMPTITDVRTKGQAERAAIQLGEELKGAEAEAAKTAQAKGTRQELALREAEQRFGTAATRAKEESKTSLNNIAKPSNEFEVGEGLRQVGKRNERQLEISADRAAKVLKDAYFKEGKAKEAAGQYWSRSQTGSEFMRYLKDVMSPENAGKYNQYEIAAARDLYRDLETQFARTEFGGLKAIPSQIEKIEKVIRDTKKLPSKPTMTGADAMKQQYMGKLAQKLEDSVYGYVDEAGAAVEGFAPTGRTFRQVYAKMMQPLNAYESPVGQVISKEVQGLRDIFMSDASEIPAKVFQSPEQIKVLEKMDISKKTLEPYAARHVANELSKLNTAEQVKAWINSTKGSFLKEFPELQSKVNKYAEIFAKNEAEVAKREAGIKAISAKRGEVVKGREAAGEAATDAIKTIEGLQKFSPNKIGPQAIKIVSDLRGRNLISPQQAAQIEAQILQVDKTYQGAEKLRKMRNILLYAVAGTYGGYTTGKLLLGY